MVFFLKLYFYIYIYPHIRLLCTLFLCGIFIEFTTIYAEGVEYYDNIQRFQYIYANYDQLNYTLLDCITQSYYNKFEELSFIIVLNSIVPNTSVVLRLYDDIDIYI